MNSIKKIAIVGCTLLASTALLVSFTNGNDDDKKKKKKYQIIHHSNGEVITHDTIIPMSSSYTPEEFVAEMGISSEHLEVINIPAISDLELDGTMMRTFVSEVDFESDGDGSEEKVEIFVEMDENGDMEAKKIVNGVEVEMTEDELREIKSHHGDHDKMVRVHIGDENMREKGERVEISVEIDDEGNETVKKIVNGEEVEITDEELKEIRSHHGEHDKMIHVRIDDENIGDMDERIEISVEIDDEGNKTVKKIVNGEEVEMTDTELKEHMEIMDMTHGDDMRVFIHTEELEEDLKELELKIEKMIEEGGDDVKVITKRIEMHSDENHFDWESENGGERIMIRSIGDENMEDHTIVLVTENYDESAEGQTNVRLEQSNEKLDVYPNPNDGTFTIRYESDENKKTSIAVTDANGKKVFKEDLGKFSGSYEKELNLKEFGSGMYTIIIQNGNNKEVQKVMIK